MDIVDRLFELVDGKFEEQQDFAAVLGVNPTLPSRWRNRKSSSYQRRLPQIAEVLGTTTEYLLTGSGPKYRDQAGLFVDTSGSMAGAIADLDLGSGEAAARLGKKEPAPMNGDGLSSAKRRLWEAVDDLTDEQCEKLLGIVLEAKRLL